MIRLLCHLFIAVKFQVWKCEPSGTAFSLIATVPLDFPHSGSYSTAYDIFFDRTTPVMSTPLLQSAISFQSEYAVLSSPVSLYSHSALLASTSASSTQSSQSTSSQPGSSPARIRLSTSIGLSGPYIKPPLPLEPPPGSSTSSALETQTALSLGLVPPHVSGSRPIIWRNSIAHVKVTVVHLSTYKARSRAKLKIFNGLTCVSGETLTKTKPKQEVIEPSKWMVLVTEESYQYYLNTQTGETTWDKPDDFYENDTPIQFGRAELVEPPPPILHQMETFGLEDVVL